MIKLSGKEKFNFFHRFKQLENFSHTCYEDMTILAEWNASNSEYNLHLPARLSDYPRNDITRDERSLLLVRDLSRHGDREVDIVMVTVLS